MPDLRACMHTSQRWPSMFSVREPGVACNNSRVQRATKSADGTRIAYRIHGSGDRTVVFVHGWMMSGAVFSELLDAWQPAGVRVIVPDLRSAGESGPAQAGYDLDRYVEDVLAVLDAEGIPRAVLLGHSMGGQIAQLVAATRPERVAGLVAVVPVPVDGLPLPEEVKRDVSRAPAAAAKRSAGSSTWRAPA